MFVTEFIDSTDKLFESEEEFEILNVWRASTPDPAKVNADGDLAPPVQAWLGAVSWAIEVPQITQRPSIKLITSLQKSKSAKAWTQQGRSAEGGRQAQVPSLWYTDKAKDYNSIYSKESLFKGL